MSSRQLIYYKGVGLNVIYTFTKGHPGTLYHSDMSGTPPEQAEVELHEIEINKQDAWDLLEDQIEDIQEYILENIENER